MGNDLAFGRRSRWGKRALLGLSLLAGAAGSLMAANDYPLGSSFPPGIFPSCPPCDPSVVMPAKPHKAPADPNQTEPKSTDPNAADPNAADPNAADPNAADPNRQMTDPNQVFNQPDASTSQAASATNATSPNMIGDFFGTVGSPTFYRSLSYGNIGSFNSSPVYPGPNTSVGGRQKIAEGFNPLPRDRVFFNYSFFDSVPLTSNGVDVNRYTLGFEKTFFNGLTSVEFRAPLLSTLSSDVHTAALQNDNFEFGNINIAAKVLMSRTATSAWSTGVAFTIPTADDIRLFSDTDVEVMKYSNHSLHVLPFLGYLYTPNDRSFTQLLMQLDYDTNGNPVYVRNDTTGGLQRVGTAKDADFLYLSASTGYWIYRSDSPSSFIRGLAPIAEVHWNRSIRRPDGLAGDVGGALFQAGQSFKTIDVTNFTCGLQAQVGNSSSVTAGYCTPMGGGSDQQFNGEFRLLVNVLFGRSAGANNRAARVAFP